MGGDLARSPCWHRCQPPPPQCALCSRQAARRVCGAICSAPWQAPERRWGGAPVLLSAHSGPEMDWSVYKVFHEASLLPLLCSLPVTVRMALGGTGSLRDLGSQLPVHKALQSLAEGKKEN